MTRREAAAWCQQQNVPYFETHPAEKPYPRVLHHLGGAILVPRGSASSLVEMELPTRTRKKPK